MATTEIEGAHGLPRDTNAISNELQQVIHCMGCRYENKTIKTNYSLRYSHRVIARVNKEEENVEG